MTKSLLTTFDGDIYIIEKTPDEISEIINNQNISDMLRMPNGSRIHKKSISKIQTYEDYSFQTDQKVRHKKGQFLRSGKWNDFTGPLHIGAGLEKITGELNSNLLQSKN